MARTLLIKVCWIIVEHLNVNEFENMVTFLLSFIQQWIRHLDCHFGDYLMEYLSQEWVSSNLWCYPCLVHCVKFDFEDRQEEVTAQCHVCWIWGCRFLTVYPNCHIFLIWLRKHLQQTLLLNFKREIYMSGWNLTNMLKSFVLLLRKQYIKSMGIHKFVKVVCTLKTLCKMKIHKSEMIFP
jgi:hypothetical protein